MMLDGVWWTTSPPARAPPARQCPPGTTGLRAHDPKTAIYIAAGTRVKRGVVPFWGISEEKFRIRFLVTVARVSSFLYS